MLSEKLKGLLFEGEEHLNRKVQDCFNRMDISLITKELNEDNLKESLQEKIDFILMDLGCRWSDKKLSFIKDLKAMKDIPIFLLSNFSDQDKIIAALESGADDYFIKPLDENLISSRIFKVLKHQIEGDMPLFRVPDYLRLVNFEYAFEIARIDEKGIYFYSKDFFTRGQTLKLKGEDLCPFIEGKESILLQLSSAKPDLQTGNFYYHAQFVNLSLEEEEHLRQQILRHME